MVLLMLLGAALPARFAAAAEPAPSIDADYSAGLLDPAPVIAAAQAIRAEDFPDADDILVDGLQRVFYRPDGTSVTWDESYFKVLTEKGRRDGRTLAIGYNETYGSARLCRLEVIRPDGSRHPVDIPSNSRVTVDSSMMEANIYDPHDKLLQAVIPELGIGDTIRVLTQRTETKPRVPNTWSDFNVFEYTSPIRRQTYEVYAPRDLPLRSVALKAQVPGTVAATNLPWAGGTLHRWEVRDVPRMFEEPAMPDAYMVVQRLLVSTLPDWPTVSRWYWNLCAPRLQAITPEMRKKAAELTAAGATPRAKIEALFKFVSQQIRYMGVTAESEAPGYEPHDVSLTFGNRYGVCRDKAALLVALLRLAGIEAFPVIIHAGPKKDEEVPAPFFNHAIAAARLDGQYILMDPTDETTRDLLPSYLGDKSYLVATPEGDPLRTSPIVPAEENLVKIRTEGRITDDGRLAARTVFDLEGINDNVYRQMFAGRKPEDRRRTIEGLIKMFVPGAQLTEFRIEPANLQDTSRSLRITTGYEAADVVIAGEATALLPTPWFGAAVGLVNYLQDAMGLEKRRFPLRTDIACGVREDLRLTLGAAVGEPVSLPKAESLDTATLKWDRTFAVTNRVLTGHSEFLMKAVEYSPAEYLALKKALKTVEFDQRKKPIFRPGKPAVAAAAPAPRAAPAPDSADVTVERLDREITLHDAQSWDERLTVRKRIHTYAGVKDHSEVKVDYNPAWEKVELAYARVTTAEGELREVTPKEINLMDAPWNGEAPRYPDGKTLVISLPGVETGALVDYQLVFHRKDRPLFDALETFGGSDPVTVQTLRLDAPDNLPLRMDVTDGDALAADRTRHDDRVVYTWIATNRPPVAAERSLPPPWVIQPAVFVSAGNWRGYAKDVQSRFDAAAQPGPLARQLAGEALKGLTNALDRIQALRDLAARRLRPAGPDFSDLPLATLTPAETTLRDGYGHAADRAIALAALLRAGGFEPEFLLSAGEPECEAVTGPFRRHTAPAFFYEPLVRVSDGGQTLVLNDTDQYARLGATPHDGHPALELPGGRIRPIEAPEEARDRSATHYDLRIEADGAAHIEVTIWHRGDDYGEFRRAYRELPPEERRRKHEEMVSAISQNAVAEGPLITDTETYPGRESFAVRVEHFAVRDGARLYFTLPGGADPLPGLSTDARGNPLYWDEPADQREDITVRLPPQFRRAELLPPEADLRAPRDAARIVFRTAWTEDPDGYRRLTRTRETRIAPAVLEAADYPALLELNRRQLHRRMSVVMVSEE